MMRYLSRSRTAYTLMAGIFVLAGCGSSGKTVSEAFQSPPDMEVVDSIEQFRQAMDQSGGKFRVKPGVYKVVDAEADNQTVFHCNGNDNYFDMRGVTIQIDTRVLADLRGPEHSLTVYRVKGSNLTFKGAVFESIGDNAPFRSLQDFSVYGDNCTFEDCTFIVRGCSPYGYGDLLGKGKDRVTRLQKHSGVQIMGANTTLRRCKVINYAFGHCFFVQGGLNTRFEDCYAEGQMRSTTEMLKDTSGPAFEVNFASVYKNREGQAVITPGYMKCLCEDGFRTYSKGGPGGRPTGKVTLINCTAKNTRAGFEITGPADGPDKTILRNCTAIGCERAYLIGDNVVTWKCRGDAQYGPLLYLRGGSGSDIELGLIGGGSEYTVHALATVAGKNHRLKIYQQGKALKRSPVPIMVGYEMPEHAEMSSPIKPGLAENIKLVNSTLMPLMMSDRTVDCEIETNGNVDVNHSRQTSVNTLKVNNN